MATKKLAFGYNPPTGEPGFETIRQATFVADLHRMLDVAATAFESIWLADHLQFGTKYGSSAGRSWRGSPRAIRG